MASNTLRMSGLNSGLDTEAIVNALTAATKNKINTNQRKVLKLQAQQEAYRSIIDKFNAFKDKYFDILNVGTCLKSKSLFNSYKSTLTSSSGTNYVPGVTVSSSVNANPGVYNVKVNAVATQSKRESAGGASSKGLDLDQYEEGKQYTMSVTVGSKTAQVTFDGGNAEDIRAQINEQLKDAFGSTNSTKDTGLGMVYIDENNKFVSADKASVVTKNPVLYSKDQRDLTGELGNGSNSITITVNGVTKTVTFSTITEDYFDELFDESGKLLTKDEIAEKIQNSDLSDKEKEEKAVELEERLALYKQVVLNQRDGEVYDSYKAWWDGLDPDQMKAAAKNIAEKEYQKEYDAIETDYRKRLETQTQLAAYEEAKANGEEYESFQDFLDQHPFTEEDYEAYLETMDGQVLKMEHDFSLEHLEAKYEGYTNEIVEKESKALHDTTFDEAKRAAYDEYVNDMVSQGHQPEDEAVTKFEDFEYTEEDFESSAKYQSYLDGKQEIEDKYADVKTFDIERMSESERLAMFEEYYYEDLGGLSEEDYINSFQGAEGTGFTAAKEAAYQFNKANIENNLNSLYFNRTEGNILTRNAYSVQAEYDRDGNLTVKVIDQTLADEDGNLPEGVEDDKVQFAITQGAGNATKFSEDGVEMDTTDVTGTANQISTSSKLNELGLDPDDNGNYSFTINGVKFSFSGDTTISDMMKQVNASTAGVKMTYTTLTNQFVITANEYGRGVDINIKDGGQNLLGALGFEDGGKFTEGTNTELNINGVDVETTSNSYTVDGTTFTFTQAAVGQEFTNEVSRDYSKAIDTIKSFVEDYNKLIEEIYGYVDDEPNSDYYFLTDDDIEQMDLSESQQNKWETMAKKGILHGDSTLTGIMSKLRMVIYNTVDAADGSKVGLYTLGITTSSDYSNHGKLVFDSNMTEEEFASIFATYADEFATLFTDSEKGIATQFESIINSAVRTSGAPEDRGVLVQKAGVSGTASATSNTIYNQIKNLQDMIRTLQERYEQQQDRYWKIYGNMETMLGNLNGQTSYINQLMGNF